MRLKIYQVDAFGRGVFTGNPAAVVPLKRWLADDTLGAIVYACDAGSKSAYMVDSSFNHVRRDT